MKRRGGRCCCLPAPPGIGSSWTAIASKPMGSHLCISAAARTSSRSGALGRPTPSSSLAAGRFSYNKTPLRMPPSSKPYGIDRAIELMRSLRAERDPDLVATVITTTLESVDTKVTDIIEEAKSRQADLEARIAVIKARNGALEREIELGVDEIVELEASLAEIMSVTERLEQARNSVR